MKFGLESETLEFKKSTSEMKEACISICAILNKHGVGTLYFGIKPDGTVIGQEISEATLRDVSRKIYESIKPQIYPVIEQVTADGKYLIKVEFNGEESPYSVYGKYYLRTADEDRMVTPQKLKQIFSESVYRESWEHGDSGSSIEIVDHESIDEFLEMATTFGRLPDNDFSTKIFLSKLGLLYGDNLNNAGEILFGNNQPLTVKMALFATEKKITFLDQRRVNDNLFNLFPIVEKYILKNLNWRSEIEGLERIEIPEIPLPVIREVIANSFAHAKYQSSIQHEICIFPDKITIYNPGTFASPYSLEDYVQDNLPSVARNALIAKSLYLCKRIEQFGSGIKRIDSLCKDAGIRYSYENDELGFMFILHRSHDKSVTIDVTTDVTLNETEKSVLVLLKNNPVQTREELAEQISKTVRTVQRALNGLRDKGYIQRIGSKADNTWEVLK